MQCACYEGWGGADCSQPSGLAKKIDPTASSKPQTQQDVELSSPTSSSLGESHPADRIKIQTGQRAVTTYPPGLGTAVGDPGMLLAPRVLMEGWTFCNRAGGSCEVGPRWADCTPDAGEPAGPGPDGNLVTLANNAAGLNASAPQGQCDPFTQAKERHLGTICERPVTGSNSSFFWTGMLKSGNMDDNEECKTCGLWCAPSCCPTVQEPMPMSRHSGGNSVAALRGAKASAVSLPADGVHGRASAHRLGFDNLPMNQPYVKQRWTQGSAASKDWSGAIFGSWDSASS